MPSRWRASWKDYAPGASTSACGGDSGLPAAPGSRPAIVHAFHAYRTGPLGLSLARSSGAPLVVTLTGTDVSGDLRDAARGPQVREVLLGATAITAFHESITAEIAARPPRGRRTARRRAPERVAASRERRSASGAVPSPVAR